MCHPCTRQAGINYSRDPVTILIVPGFPLVGGNDNKKNSPF